MNFQLLRSIAIATASFVSYSANGQSLTPAQPSAGELLLGMQRLGTHANVLYVAAHPDDENTRFIAWAANHIGARTTYLSITRGDGGQNLIGPELGPELGLIRTQELVAARLTDGGRQHFTRANDFGYSKTTEETLEIWDRNQVLEDMVYVIRLTRPDVIVCRFPPDSRAGHGHHSASAVLAREAFDMAADPAAFPDQLKAFQPHRATRIVKNTGRWWSENISEEDPGVVAHDLGGYNPLTGLSYTEMAARSRSLHKSQGFGSTGTRGEQKEFFEHFGGIEAKESIFDNITTDASRLPSNHGLSAKYGSLVSQFEPTAPWLSLPALAAIHRAYNVVNDDFWKDQKQAEAARLMADCAGLFAEARADQFAAPDGDRIKVSFEIINRSPAAVTLDGIRSLGGLFLIRPGVTLQPNVAFTLDTMLTVRGALSQPYHLQAEGKAGMYAGSDPLLRTMPEGWPAIAFTAVVTVEGIPAERPMPLIHRWTDPVAGEQKRPFVIVPPVTIHCDQRTIVSPPGAERTLRYTLTAQRPDSGLFAVTLPTGWSCKGEKMNIVTSAGIATETLVPATNGKIPQYHVAFKLKGEEMTFEFAVMSGTDTQAGDATANFVNDAGIHSHDMRTIAHPHIPHIVHFPEAVVKLVPADLRINGEKVGYIQGAGDQVDAAIVQMGYEVVPLTEADLRGDLSGLQAIVLGIRAVNTLDNIDKMVPLLHDYAEAGGNVIVQYCVSRGLKMENFAPLPLMLGRDRVTEEDAAPTFLLPDDPALNVPNRITSSDFLGWVQERGLYFGSTWHESYRAPIGWADTGEEAKKGALLILPHGKGHFVYTGISFFRQMPEGVPGAYRLLANLISLE